MDKMIKVEDGVIMDQRGRKCVIDPAEPVEMPEPAEPVSVEIDYQALRRMLYGE